MPGASATLSIVVAPASWTFSAGSRGRGQRRRRCAVPAPTLRLGRVRVSHDAVEDVEAVDLLPRASLDAGERDARGRNCQSSMEAAEHAGPGPPRGGAAEHRHAAQLVVGRGRQLGTLCRRRDEVAVVEAADAASRGHAGEAPRASGATRCPGARPASRERAGPSEARSDGGGTRRDGREARRRESAAGSAAGSRGRAENGRHARATR